MEEAKSEHQTVSKSKKNFNDSKLSARQKEALALAESQGVTRFSSIQELIELFKNLNIPQKDCDDLHQTIMNERLRQRQKIRSQ